MSSARARKRLIGLAHNFVRSDGTENLNNWPNIAKHDRGVYFGFAWYVWCKSHSKTCRFVAAEIKRVFVVI
jgi:hypothetical protein